MKIPPSALRWSSLLLLVGAAPLQAQGSPCPLINGDDAEPELAANATPPLYQRGPLPRPPETAAAHDNGGVVELMFIVGCDGRVDSSSIVVKRASDTAFTPSAISAMAHTEFKPATSHGKKVAMRIVQRVNFAPVTYHDARGFVVPRAATAYGRSVGEKGCALRDIDTTDAHKPGFVPVRYLNGPLPKYPSELKSAGPEGRVSLRFIVGCDGRAEPGSIVVKDATNQAFVAPSIAAIVGTRFSAATLDGEPIRQLVDQAVGFLLRGGTPVRSSQPPWWVSRTQRP